MHEDPLATLTRDLTELGRRARAAGSETEIDDEILAELRLARIRQRTALAGRAFALAACVILGGTLVSVAITLNGRRQGNDFADPASVPRVHAPAPEPSTPTHGGTSLSGPNRASTSPPASADPLEHLLLPEDHPPEPPTRARQPAPPGNIEPHDRP